MPEIIIDSVDNDTAKKNAVVTWRREDEDYLQFLVVPLKDWNRQVEFESPEPACSYHLKNRRCPILPDAA